jgi:branched-chain amino acid transport system substrate-binding protein
LAVTFLVQVPTVKLAATCRAQGYTGAFAILAVSDQNFDKLPAPTYGVDLDFPWWSTAKPVVQYRNVMAQYAPGVDYQGYHQTNMWSLLTLFSYAMDKSGPAASASASGADVISAYRTAVKNVTLDGLLPQPITYSQSGNTVVNCFWPVDHLADGSYKTLAGSGASGNGATGDLASTCVS